jgi:type I restriction enzyme M protein
LSFSALESWTWKAACVIRGAVDAPKFKEYIIPLIFLKRLSDVFQDEIKALEQDFGSHLGLRGTPHEQKATAKTRRGRGAKRVGVLCACAPWRLVTGQTRCRQPGDVARHQRRKAP